MLAGVPVHVVQRGHNHSPCFFAPTDYALYLQDVAALAPRFGCTVHAYCLMTNHVHLLITPTTAQGCALLMKHLGQRHAQRVNRTYRRSGTLWEGRFRSCLIEEERYCLASQRYVELNPLRAGVVSRPGDYPWSSYRRHAGVASEDEAGIGIESHSAYLALGIDDTARRAMYRALCMMTLDRRMVDAIRQATNGGFVLGSARFAAEVANRLGRRVARGTPGRPAKLAPSDTVPTAALGWAPQIAVRTDTEVVAVSDAFRR
jgi:putative transposase